MQGAFLVALTRPAEPTAAGEREVHVHIYGTKLPLQEVHVCMGGGGGGTVRSSEVGV